MEEHKRDYKNEWEMPPQVVSRKKKTCSVGRNRESQRLGREGGVGGAGFFEKGRLPCGTAKIWGKYKRGTGDMGHCKKIIAEKKF